MLFSAGCSSRPATASLTPITFDVPRDAPDTLYYDCGVHISMEGVISIDGVFIDSFDTP